MSQKLNLAIGALLASLFVGCQLLAPEPTATPVPTNTGTPTATATFTATPTNTPTATPTATATATPTATPTNTPTATATPTDTPTPRPTVAPTNTPTPDVLPQIFVRSKSALGEWCAYSIGVVGFQSDETLVWTMTAPNGEINSFPGVLGVNQSFIFTAQHPSGDYVLTLQGTQHSAQLVINWTGSC